MRPGRKWRLRTQSNGVLFTAENVSEFDELVVDGWLHVERMSHREWWMRLGETDFGIRVNRDGSATVTVTEGGEHLRGMR